LENVPKKHFLLYSILVLFGIGIAMPARAQSVLATGKWYKVAVQKDGVYKISYKTFRKMGFDVSKTDPRKIKIYGNEGGMLPQPNQAQRPEDLVENAILVTGEADGKFNSNDFILFYAQGADKYSFKQSKGIIAYEKNLYADKNYYFITVSETNGKRVTTDAAVPGNLPAVNSYENFYYHELDEYSELKSGREWFGERFDLTPELTLDADIENVVSGSTIKLVSGVMAKAFLPSSFTVSINGTQTLTQSVPSIPNDRYTVKGAIRNDTISVSADAVLAIGKSAQKIKYTYNKASSGQSVGFLNFVLLQATQALTLDGPQTIFRSLASIENPASKFEINNSSSSAAVWDVSNPYEPRAISSSFNTGTTAFNAVTSVVKEFVVFTPDVAAPELVGKITNQDLHSLSTPRLLIITHPAFRSQAERLAEYRNSRNIATTVVTTEQVYHEFSSGRQDVTALRDFIKFLYDKNPAALKSVLLVGKGSYDYKKRVVDNLNFVPVYESRNSLHPVDSYSSDDYFGFLEENEGIWSESPAINHTLDVAVGRLPVKSSLEAAQVVDKIIRYESEASIQGFWQKEIVFVADDGDGNLHQEDADDLSESIDEDHSEFDVSKIYLDQFLQISKPGGEVSPETNEAIERGFNKGALIINYTGHGGERLLAQERIFDEIMISKLKNDQWPVLVTATCEFGKSDDPMVISGGEQCLLKENAGAIALVTTGRPVEASTNFVLNKAFYNAFFERENNKPLTLGEIFRRTKNSSLSGVSNRNFSLLGDPELQLALPSRSIIVTEVKTESGSTTLKSLSTVLVKGEVQDENGIDEDFNGLLEAALFDKKVSFQTLGNENSPFPYQQWYNRLFRGQAKVENGLFEFNFVVPKNIAFQIAEGKLSLYARDSAQQLTASGFSKSFTVGSSESNPDADTTPPVIQLFVGDTTFLAGGIANPNTQLVARLYDSHGINISGYGIGNSLTAIIDGESFVVNDYYIADVNNHTRGTVVFPLADLTPGTHTLSLKAWDTYNNPAQATIEFTVTDTEKLVIHSLGNYPNPFQTSTKVTFTHNRSGDDLAGTLTLYDLTGSVLQTYDFNIPSSTYQVELPELIPGVNLPKNQGGGLYFARLSLRSLTNGSKNEQVTKLILSN
jgi:Peptidase family C25